MDTVSALITRINVETPASSPKLPSSKSNATKQEQADIPDTPTGDIPPPQFTSSINELRSFSTALSAFFSRYDELHNHLNFIKSSVDSNLPNQLVDTGNPNYSALTHLLETCCDQSITSFPEVIVSEQNPKLSASDCERSHAITTTPVYTNFLHNFKETDTWKTPEVADVSNNPLEIDASEVVDVLKNCLEIDAFEVADVSNNPLEIDVSENPLEIDASEVVDVLKNCLEIDAFEAADVLKNPLGIDVSENSVEIDVLKKPETVDVSKNPEEIDVSESPLEIDASEVADVLKNTVEIDVSENPVEIDALKKPEAADLLKNHEELDVYENPIEIDASKVADVLENHVEIGSASVTLEETVLETSCDQTITPVPEAIFSERNPNRMATDCEQSPENVSTPENIEEIDVLMKPEQTDICKNLEESPVLKKPEELNISVIAEKNDTSKNREDIDTLEKLEQTGILKKPEKVDTLKKHKETGTCKKAKEPKTSKNSVVSELERLCESMSSKGMKGHIAKHYFEMINLREEIAKALKLAKDPAKLVLKSIGRFFVQCSKTFCKPNQKKHNLARMVAVLILECFVMISSDDDIEIAKSDLQYAAASAAVSWRTRMMKEGGPRHTDEVDARGLLLLISGFGIQDQVFKIQDIMDLIRASNVKAICTALRRSVFLVPKIPEVIDLMVKNNLEIEAADIAHTFRLEDKCHPQNILALFLQNKIKNIQNGSSLQMLEEMKQQLLDLKSVKQCLESLNIDPSMHLADFKINEKIQNLEKEINERKLSQKRKSLGNPIDKEAKRACVSHQNMPHKRMGVDHHGMNRSTQPSTWYFDSNRHLGNSYISNRSASSVNDAPENLTGLVYNGVAGGFYVQPYVWYGPYVYGQTYDSQSYGRPWGWGPQ